MRKVADIMRDLAHTIAIEINEAGEKADAASEQLSLSEGLTPETRAVRLDESRSVSGGGVE